MIEQPPGSSGVDLLDVRSIRFVETAAPWLSSEERSALDRVWEDAVRANPNLFDGPVAACAGLEREDPHGLVITWARTTYRHYALRRVKGTARRLPALFVSVLQPTEDGRLMVGRMSSATAAPGRWQLPGGSLEPPEGDRPLDLAALRGHAARELVEETGVETAAEELTLWRVTLGAGGNVGALFTAPRRPVALLHDRFRALVSSEEALGREPELDRFALVRSPAGLARLTGPHVDYLEPVVRLFTGAAPPP
ncbi:NUDIX domain-containing protein [Streptomyces sp. NPDC046984]|uniref:NUDIX hydrolase n=1 Tax=Streptomyces sp. NPDC046984 TaxID=3155138 RepID=UPI0033C33E75